MNGLRGSRYISNKQATAYFAATKHARQHEQAPNVVVTLNLSHTACPPGLASVAIQTLIRNRFGRWLRYHAEKAAKAKQPGFGPPTYTWVIEAKEGFHHAHWCVHVDPRLRQDFEKKLPRWLTKAAGEIEQPIGAIKLQDIYALMGLARYCMKGIHPYHAGKRYITPEDQGEVWGQRVGISRSLGRAARRRHWDVQQAA